VSTLRALPTLMRIGFMDALAYRAEMLVWILSTTMPLVMLALFQAVAADGNIGRFGPDEITAYFLATFVVRQLISCWAAWQMNFEVRQGTLALRLMRPLHPVVAYAIEHLAAIPMRMIVAVPIAMIALVVAGADQVTTSALQWAIWPLAVIGGFLITFFVHIAIGCLSLYMESSLKVLDVWFAAHLVFSGYLIPVELFPPSLRDIADVLPFRYQIGFPVELMTRGHDAAGALTMLAAQWTYVAVFAIAAAILWRGGLRRFAAYGG
jgi:ABC-2 type transport system permease protein